MDHFLYKVYLRILSEEVFIGVATENHRFDLLDAYKTKNNLSNIEMDKFGFELVGFNGYILAEKL